MITFALFLFGLLLGSFLSVVFHRLEIDEKTGFARLALPGKRQAKSKSSKAGAKELLVGRSACDHCGKEIRWYDNVPLVSYLLLRGRCRHCRKPISHYHPVLELSTGLLLGATYAYYHAFSAQFFFIAVFGMVLLLLFAYDLKHHLLPDVIVVPALVLALAVIVLEYGLRSHIPPVHIGPYSTDPDNYLLGGGVVGGFFLAMSIVSKGRWIGGGDIKLGTLIGLLLGWPYALVALLLSYLIGTFYAVILLARREASLQSTMAFGPMLVLAWLVTTFYGDRIVQWYNGLIIG